MLWAFTWLCFLVATYTSSLSPDFLEIFIVRDERFGLHLWDLLFWFSVLLSAVCFLLFFARAWSSEWRLRRGGVLLIFMSLCIGFPAVMRNLEAPAYRLAKDRVHFLEKRLLEVDEITGEPLRAEFDQLLHARWSHMLERYEEQR